MNQEDLNFEKQYTKGWTDETLWRDFHAAQWEGDFFEMDCIIRAQGAERPPVGARVTRSLSQHTDLFNLFPVTVPDIDSPQLKKEFELLTVLEKIRDMPLTEVAGYGYPIPNSLYKLSLFSHAFQVAQYQPGVDYMDNHADYMRIQKGLKVPAPPKGAASPLLTGRHLATFVHADNPMMNWMPVIDWLFDNGVALRTEFSPMTTETPESPGFVCWGPLEIYGLVAMALRECGKISFRQKWWSLGVRPEEYAYKKGLAFLSQCFPEGSPTHPSFNAMHAFAAYVMAFVILAIFDSHHVISDTGTTVGEEVLQWAANIADARLWAGVHFMSDNEAVRERAKALAERIVSEALGVEV